MSQAANDLNFTFVIDESQGDRLVRQLHERLIQSIGSDQVLGPTWLQLFAPQDAGRAGARATGGKIRPRRASCSRSRRAGVRGLRIRHGEHRRGDCGAALGPVGRAAGRIR